MSATGFQCKATAVYLDHAGEHPDLMFCCPHSKKRQYGLATQAMLVQHVLLMRACICRLTCNRHMLQVANACQCIVCEWDASVDSFRRCPTALPLPWHTIKCNRLLSHVHEAPIHNEGDEQYDRKPAQKRSYNYIFTCDAICTPRCTRLHGGSCSGQPHRHLSFSCTSQIMRMHYTYCRRLEAPQVRTPSILAVASPK